MLSVVWAILKGLLILLAVLLALVVLLLLLPATVSLRYEQEKLEVRAGMLGVKVRVYPFKQKEKKPRKHKKKRPKKQAQPDQKSAAKKKKFKLSVQVICELVRTAGWLMGRILAGLHIRDVRLRLPIQGSDAADTAVQYGKTHAWLHSALGVLQNGLDIRVRELALVPDFTGQKQGTELFSCKITGRLIIMIMACVRALVRLARAGVL